MRVALDMHGFSKPIYFFLPSTSLQLLLLILAALYKYIITPHSSTLPCLFFPRIGSQTVYSYSTGRAYSSHKYYSRNWVTAVSKSILASYSSCFRLYPTCMRRDLRRSIHTYFSAITPPLHVLMALLRVRSPVRGQHTAVQHHISRFLAFFLPRESLSHQIGHTDRVRVKVSHSNCPSVYPI